MQSARPPLRDPAEAFAAFRRLRAAGPLLEAVTADDDVWLVGGAVRDLLLGVEPHELDLTVVGDSTALAERIGPVVARHERFGTVQVEPEPGTHYDIARARTERYATPGALPDVEPAARIDDDLRRRDVSLNAIAMRVADGRIVALPGAIDDLAAGRLRVLHARSFVDDPTRVWRVARYAARLRFSIEPSTRALAHAADPTTISGSRHGAELRLALNEPDPAAVFTTLVELNPRFVPVGFDPDPATVPAALSLLPPGGRADLVRLAASCASVSLPDLLPWLDALELTTSEREIVGAGSRASSFGPLRTARLRSEIHRAAVGAPDELVALAGGPNAQLWFDELRQVRLLIGGHDLLASGVPAGPELGARLRRALDAKLDERLNPALSERDAELAVALEPLNAGESS